MEQREVRAEAATLTIFSRLVTEERAARLQPSCKKPFHPHNGGVREGAVLEKRKETYALAAIKMAFREPTVLNRTFSAAEGAEDLGMSDIEVVAIVQALTKADFEKSMTSYADSKFWQDVYRPIVRGDRLYVKFTRDAQGDLLLISFKKA